MDSDSAVTLNPPSGADAASSNTDTGLLQQSALRKNAWRMLPTLTLAFIFNYIDRTSVGFAGLTMNHDVGLTATEFGWGAGILFVGYCVFEIPSNLALQRFGARRWLSRIMITWGLASALTAFVVGPYSFYAARFLLGVAEAGFFPGAAYLVAAWFPAQYRTRALATLALAVPLSSVIGGPFSVLLLEMNGLYGLRGWQWMFLVQGLPACILGILALRTLRDHPKDAHWLTPAERDALISMLNAEPRKRVVTSLLGALTDTRVLMLAAIQFGFVVSSYGVGIWLPMILEGHGLKNLAVGFTSAIPYACATIGMLLWARHVDRGGSKTTNLAGSCFLAAAGLLTSVSAGSFIPSFIGLTVALIGVTAARAIFWTIPAGFLSGVAAAGGLAFINSVGALGGFVGPFTIGWLKDVTGSFNTGLVVLACLGSISAILTLALRLLMRQEADH
jgi:ACS family tartrate transporter-like MFS transporter